MPSFRRANEGDLDRLVEIHSSAFPDPRGPDARRRNFLYNIFGELPDLRVAEVSGVIVAHAFLFPLELAFGGQRVRTGGIASVGVAPEARGTGVAAKMLDHLHAQSRVRGDAITVLYGFRQGFYARQGYAPASAYRRLHMSPRAIPAAWHTRKVRAALPTDRAAIGACYDRAFSRSTGFIARAPRFWDARLLDEARRWFVVDGATPHTIQGYVSWTIAQAEPHARTAMAVHDLVADTDDTKRALYGLLAAQRDQVTEVEIDVAADDPIDRALVDVDQMRFGTEKVEHTLGQVVGGPMVRIVDVARALGARGYVHDGVVDFHLDATSSVVAVEAKDGRGQLVPPGRGAALRVRGDVLAALLYGTLSASDAARLGWVDGDARALATADAVLGLPAYFALDPF